MKQSEISHKTLNYQLLDSYQTNSPIYCAEETFRTPCYKEEYMDALFTFLKQLQKAFAFDSVFNDPRQTEVQQKYVKKLFHKCFRIYPPSEREQLFEIEIENVIGGFNGDYNFAYGLKLYILFQEELGLSRFKRKLFESRVKRNIVSKYYTENPQKDNISLTEIATTIYTPLTQKLARYKFYQKTSF